MGDFYKVSFTVRCRQCALQLFRAAVDAHGYRATSGGVSLHDEEGVYQHNIASVGAATFIPGDADRPCEKHRPRLEVRNV